MAKNYSGDTKQCLVWFREPHHSGEAGASGQPLGVVPPLPVITYLDGKLKATPHRSEALNVSHFNIFGSGEVDVSPRGAGKRTLAQVKALIDKDAEEHQDNAGLRLPLSARAAGKKPSDYFLNGEAPPIPLKKPGPGWEWQRRILTLAHSDEAGTTSAAAGTVSPRVKGSTQSNIAKAKFFKEKVAKEKFRQHWKAVARLHAVNRIPIRKVEHITPPDPYEVIHYTPGPTIPHPPKFVHLPEHHRCKGAHKEEIRLGIPLSESHPEAAVTTTEAAVTPRAATTTGPVVVPAPPAAAKPKNRPMSSRVLRKIDELYHTFMEHAPRGCHAQFPGNSETPRAVEGATPLQRRNSG
jgi:hypothetical protein